VNAQEFAEAGDDAPLGVFDHGSVACGAGVPARAAVAVGGEPAGGGGVGIGKEGGWACVVSVGQVPDEELPVTSCQSPIDTGVRSLVTGMGRMGASAAHECGW
jgi:hypothetical protein